MNPLRDALERASVICSTDVQLLMLDRYETTYGIYNHNLNSNERPLALVAAHAGEDTRSGSRLRERMEQFADLEVGKIFNIGVDNFLQMPRDYCLMLLEIAKKKRDVTAKLVKDQLDDFNNVNKH